MREGSSPTSHSSNVASSELGPVNVRSSATSNNSNSFSRISRASRSTLVFLLCIMSFVAITPVVITFSLDFNLFQKVFALCVAMVIIAFEVKLVYRWYMLGYFRNRRERETQVAQTENIFTISNNGTEQIEITVVAPPPPYVNIPPPPYIQSEKDIKCEEPETPKAFTETFHPLPAEKEENITQTADSGNNNNSLDSVSHA